jgi:hypothetical protein
MYGQSGARGISIFEALIGGLVSVSMAAWSAPGAAGYLSSSKCPHTLGQPESEPRGRRRARKGTERMPSLVTAWKMIIKVKRASASSGEKKPIAIAAA